jgi:hypothetical protein
MSHSDKSTLIARGRKAGLSTRELYAALAGRPSEGRDGDANRSDENGFVSRINEQGQCEYRPVDEVR